LFASLKNEVDLAEIPRPADIGDDWLMRELSNDLEGVEELKR